MMNITALAATIVSMSAAWTYNRLTCNETRFDNFNREDMTEIRNAIIESVTLDYGDRGMLTAWLFLDYGGASQGFGGYALYLPKSFKHHQLLSHAGHFITRCIQVADVAKWENIKGKTVRVKVENGLAVAIGHIVKDDWFNPSEDFKQVEEPIKPTL